MHMDRLTELQVLLAIADTGSFVAASRKLRRSAPAVTRILGGLEARAGTMLIERSSRRCQPTDAGRALIERGRQILGAYEDALEDAAGAATAAAGSLRVTAPLVFGRDHVAPAVADFLDCNPGIDIDLMLADRLIDIHEEHVDLAVRIGAIADESLIARRVGCVRRVTVASPAYLGRRGVPSAPEDVAGHDTIHSQSDGPATWTYMRGGKEIGVPIRPRLRINQADAAINAARAGRGLVTALSYQVEGDVAAGHLVRLLRDFEPPAIPVNLVYSEGRRTLRRLRLLIEHLAKAFKGLPVLDE
jgi:DNA-binding transcriptional LysR family regulator